MAPFFPEVGNKAVNDLWMCVCFGLHVIFPVDLSVYLTEDCRTGFRRQRFESSDFGKMWTNFLVGVNVASPFIERTPDGIQHIRGNEYLFYYGARPKAIHTLLVGHEFSVVYTDRWKVILFRVVPGGEGKPHVYEVVRERPLEPDEIEHFKALVAEII